MLAAVITQKGLQCIMVGLPDLLYFIGDPIFQPVSCLREGSGWGDQISHIWLQASGRIESACDAVQMETNVLLKWRTEVISAADTLGQSSSSAAFTKPEWLDNLTICLSFHLYFIEILTVCRQPVADLEGGKPAPAPILKSVQWAHMRSYCSTVPLWKVLRNPYKIDKFWSPLGIVS